MKTAVALALVASLCACGGAAPSQVSPPTASAARESGARIAESAPAGGARKAPASLGDLLYVGGDREGYIFSYPKGKLVGKLPLGSFGMCADRAGDVFFTGVRTITEYAHGATAPNAIYTVTGTAFACAVDPTTGNLAVVVLCISSCKGDEVAIFDHPGAPPTTYQDPAMQSLLFCGFDGRGNLFIDGYSNSLVSVAELPRGSSTFTNYTVQATITNPGQIQFDTRHITLQERYHPVIYRLAFNGGLATVVKKVTFTQEGVRAAQSWIFGNMIAMPNGPATKRPLDIRIWQYPIGGAPVQILSKFIPRHREIDGVVFSPAAGT